MTRRALNAAGEPTEDAFQSQVIGLLRAYGWELIYHAPDNRPAGRTGRPQRLAAPEGRGFPDVIALRGPLAHRGPRLLVAELKTRTGRVDPAQRRWLGGFRQIGQAVAEVCAIASTAKPTGVDFLDAPEHGWPSVESYLWRPADWHELHGVIRGTAEHRHDLDPL